MKIDRFAQTAGAHVESARRRVMQQWLICLSNLFCKKSSPSRGGIECPSGRRGNWDYTTNSYRPEIARETQQTRTSVKFGGQFS